jgi:hypothetical protein
MRSDPRQTEQVARDEAHPFAFSRVRTSTVSKRSRSIERFVMTSMSPSERYDSSMLVKMFLNSLYGVPADGPGWFSGSTSLLKSRGNETARVELMETSDANVSCTSERSTVSVSGELVLFRCRRHSRSSRTALQLSNSLRRAGWRGSGC